METLLTTSTHRNTYEKCKVIVETLNNPNITTYKNETLAALCIMIGNPHKLSYFNMDILVGDKEDISHLNKEVIMDILSYKYNGMLFTSKKWYKIPYLVLQAVEAELE